MQFSHTFCVRKKQRPVLKNNGAQLLHVNASDTAIYELMWEIFTLAITPLWASTLDLPYLTRVPLSGLPSPCEGRVTV